MSELAADGVPVAVTCRVLKLARQPYSRWLASQIGARELDRAHLANALFDGHRDDPELGHRLLADEAARKVAFASASRLFSALSRRISSDSTVLTPGRAPSSMSACATYRRNDSRAIPGRAPTATDAAVTDP